jgi:nucleotide-binding universal stress UspA family protein
MNEIVVHTTGCVVVGFDAGAQPTATLSAAADEAELRRTGLAIVTVMRHHIDPDLSIQGSLRTQHQAEATALQDLHRAAVSVRCNHPHVPVSTYCLGETEVSPNLEPMNTAELLVIGTHGRYDRQALILGSISRLLLTSSRCPILVIPDRTLAASTEPPVILVGVSEHPADAIVVRAAYRESLARAVPVLLAHAYSKRHGENEEQARDRATTVLAGFQAQAPTGVEVSITVIEDDPASALIRLAARASMLVVGGRTGALSGLVRESVSRAVLELVPGPVLAVPRNLTTGPSRPLAGLIVTPADQPGTVSA